MLLPHIVYYYLLAKLRTSLCYSNMGTVDVSTSTGGYVGILAR